MLEEKATILQIHEKQEVIREVQTVIFWENVSLRPRTYPPRAA